MCKCIYLSAWILRDLMHQLSRLQLENIISGIFQIKILMINVQDTLLKRYTVIVMIHSLRQFKIKNS